MRPPGCVVGQRRRPPWDVAPAASGAAWIALLGRSGHPRFTHRSGKITGMNRLFYGDNLPILRRNIRDESVDLIYLDPPFNSNRSYNVLFHSRSGADAQAQIEAFDDTWTWS